MKKAIYLLLLSALPILAKPLTGITVSGKITNTSDRKISIRGESFQKDIALKPDGSFSEALDIAYDGNYTLMTAENRISLYLAKGTKLQLTADNKKFYESILFSGKGSAENQYIARKTAISAKINQEETYKLAEADFLAKLSEIKGSMMSNYNTAKFTDADFKARELKNIYYFEQLYLLNYPSYHAHYAKIADFKPTDSFPKPDPLMNLDDEAAFLSSNSYKQIINAKFEAAVDSKLTPVDIYTAPVAMPEIKKYNSAAIRNALLQNISYEISVGNPNSSTLYQEVMALSTNEVFRKDLTEKFNKIKTLVPGKPSPAFDYENHKGGKTALSSLRGSYVYIDVWATWCGPCRQEIPSLLKIEEQYHGKNVTFVSISIDAIKDHEKWKKMVTDKNLGGVQLFADNDWKSQFVTDYAIDGIPRFILLGPDGTIINADAPRPSDPKLLDVFNDLKI